MTRQEKFAAVDEAGAAALTPAEAIRYHYDNETAFFSLWLDPALVYSAARWQAPHGKGPRASGLAEAQAAKLDFHLDAMQLPDKARILDVGCGWGALLGKAVEERGAAQAVGLTLSEDQHAHVAAQGWPHVEVLLEDVFAFQSETTFDGIVSIGAFEHFARPSMTKPEKIAIYRLFFEACHRIMAKGACLSLQTIVWDDLDFEASKKWIPQTVFPQSDIPFIDEVVAASAETFRLEYMENGREDYILTLDAWIENLKAAKDVVVDRWGEEKYVFFERYLRNSRLAFQRRKNALARFTLRRR